MTEFAVIDTETTGTDERDRIVEIAIVLLDANGKLVSEWDTLINPSIDVGPTHIHGITNSMVSMAPSFADVAGTVSQLLDGRVLVAHNLPFDQKMLDREMRRCNSEWSPGEGFDTYQATNERLSLACEFYNIKLDLSLIHI